MLVITLAAPSRRDLSTVSTVGKIGSPWAATDGDPTSEGTPSPPKAAGPPAVRVANFSAELLSASQSKEVEISALRLAAKDFLALKSLRSSCSSSSWSSSVVTSLLLGLR